MTACATGFGYFFIGITSLAVSYLLLCAIVEHLSGNSDTLTDVRRLQQRVEDLILRVDVLEAKHEYLDHIVGEIKKGKRK